MKITVSQLRRIIRETVEETMNEFDDVVSDEEFDAILVTETKSKRLNEDFGFGTILLAGVLGVLAVKGIGVAAKAAANLVGNMTLSHQEKVERNAALARQAEYKAVIDLLSNDPELANMLNTLNKMRGNASAREVRDYSKSITAYVNSQIQGMATGGRDARTLRGDVSRKMGF